MTYRQTQLLDFVKEMHGAQKRKYTGEPYWYHCMAVARLVEHLHLTEIALCHDLLEDTTCTFERLLFTLLNLGYTTREAHFIAEGVRALTDFYTSERFPKNNREWRKRQEAERLAQIPFEYQTVKYADLIDNTSSIVERDPAFAEVYLKEKRQILNVMDQGDVFLYRKALEICS